MKEKSSCISCLSRQKNIKLIVRPKPCNANIIPIVKPMSHARRWKSATVRNALKTARHVPTPAPIASFDHNALSGKCVARVKRDTALKKRQKVYPDVAAPRRFLKVFYYLPPNNPVLLNKIFTQS